MNGDVHTTKTANHTAVSCLSASTSAPNIAKLSTMSPKQQLRYQQELLERENQASSLAAAGMVAESVSLTAPHGSLGNNNNNNSNNTMPVLGLQAPPTILSQLAPTPAAATELESINWNFMDIGAMHLDDMDMDFATLFDPANELSSMQTRGSGWPHSSSEAAAAVDTSTVSPTPVLNHQDWSVVGVSSGQETKPDEAPS